MSEGCWTFRYDGNVTLSTDMWRSVRQRADSCATAGPSGFLCTRAAGHGGRHLAGAGPAIFAAWPGSQKPSDADLTEATP